MSFKTQFMNLLRQCCLSMEPGYEPRIFVCVSPISSSITKQLALRSSLTGSTASRSTSTRSTWLSTSSYPPWSSAFSTASSTGPLEKARYLVQELTHRRTLNNSSNHLESYIPAHFDFSCRTTSNLISCALSLMLG